MEYDEYIVAIERMNKLHWVDGFCAISVRELIEYGVTATTNPQTAALWHQQFRKKNKFHHPNPAIANGKTDMPPIFKFLTDAK